MSTSVTTFPLPVIPKTGKTQTNKRRYVRYNVPRAPKLQLTTVNPPRDAVHEFPQLEPQPPPHSNTGFNRLNATLYSTLNSATINSLEDNELHLPQRIQVTDWMDSFTQERDAFKSTTVCAEIIFNRVIKSTSDLPQPNLLRVATCCMLLDRISAVFGRFQPLLDSLKRELFSAIFIESLEPSVRPEGKEAPVSVSVSQSGEPPSTTTSLPPRQLPTLEGYIPEVDEVLAAKYMQRTYFEEYQQLQKVFKRYEYQAQNAERMMSQQIKVLGRAIAHWQKVFVEKVFRAWSGYSVKQQALRQKHSKFFLLWKNSNTLRAYFDRWKVFIASSQTDRLQATYEETEAGLAQMRTQTLSMSTDISRLQEDLAQERKKSQRLENSSGKWRKEAEELNSTVEEQEKTIAEFSDMTTGVQDIMKGFATEYEHKHNPTTTTFLDSQNLNVQSLPTWATWVLQQHVEGRGKTVRNIPEDLMDFHAYLVMLHVLAPAIVDREELYAQLRQQDFTKRADRVLLLMRNMGINHNITTQHLIQGFTWAHTSLLAQLFIRWCDTFTAAACLKPEFVTDNGVSGSLKQMTTAPRLQQLQQRVDTVKFGVRKWSAYASSMNESLIAFMTEQIQSEQQDEASMRIQHERDLYTTIPRDKIQDVLPAQLLEAQNIHDQIEQILSNHFISLRRIYKFYSTVDASARFNNVDCVMSQNEFWRFCSDCKIPDKKKLPRPIIQIIFNQANKISPSAEQKNNMYNPDAELVPQEFVECLVRIAATKYEDDRNNLAQKLNKLITMQILPHARESEVDSFKAELRKEAIQKVLRNYRTGLMKVFQYYASKGGVETQGANELSLQEFTALMKDCKLIDTVFSFQSLREIFIRIQDEDDPELRMIYVEFTDAIVAVAAFKHPSPFLPLHQRLNDFLATQFLNVMEQKLGVALLKKDQKKK